MQYSHSSLEIGRTHAQDGREDMLLLSDTPIHALRQECRPELAIHFFQWKEIISDKGSATVFLGVIVSDPTAANASARGAAMACATTTVSATSRSAGQLLRISATTRTMSERSDKKIFEKKHSVYCFPHVISFSDIRN